MNSDVKRLRWSLRHLGISDTAIRAAWPSWWTDQAAISQSANAELRFSLARKLGLDPRSLFDDGTPQFVWYEQTKFKRLTTQDKTEKAAISSFGTVVGRTLISATSGAREIANVTADELREGILAKQPFVRLVDLLALCWAFGIPVIHLRVFPLKAKHMCAMSVRVEGRYAIILGRDSAYPAPIAFYLAHELGHIALGHLAEGNAIIDFDLPFDGLSDPDGEEQAADKFALRLLTGSETLDFSLNTKRFSAQSLAQSVLNASLEARVEPGTLALCYGFSSGDWKKANSAFRRIYSRKKPVWREVNKIAAKQMDWSSISSDLSEFIVAVMGDHQNDEVSH